MGDYKLAIQRRCEIFTKKETNYGVFAFPSTTDALAPLGFPTHSWNQNFTPSAESQDTGSLMDRFRDKTGAGTYSFDIYARPSGTAGNVPAEDTILECAMGSKPAAASSYIMYTLAKSLPSFSMIIREDNIWYYCYGCVVDTLTCALTAAGAVGYSVSGNFKKECYAGTGTTHSPSAGATLALKNGHGKRFSVGSYIEINGDNNGGAGYEITSISTDTLTVSPSHSCNTSDAPVKGYSPTAALIGTPVEARLNNVTLQLSGENVVPEPMVTAGFTLANNLTMIEDEMDGTDYASNFIENAKRSITINMTPYFRRSTSRFFNIAVNNTQQHVRFNCGNTTGYMIRFDFPRIELDIPSPTGAEARQAALTGVSMGSSGEDEFYITYY
ncbi:MAG: phage tail tube protein [Candidatus Heimdallarchaeaceae archaeon]